MAPERDPAKSEHRSQSSPAASEAWRNWRAHAQGVQERGAAEYVLYSDSFWSAEIVDRLGPYQLLNTIAGGRSPQVGDSHPVLVLRVSYHLLDPDPMIIPVLDKAKPGSYHGGWLDEEVAALLSLALHVRCRSGGMSREFGQLADPRGRPLAIALRSPPLVAPSPGATPLIPGIARDVGVADARTFLKRYFELEPARARGLIRAARLFQQALWGADGDPRSSWLQLFAALEAAADAWSGAGAGGSARLRIAETWPDLDKLLSQVSQAKPELANQLAEELAPLVRAQYRVLRFVDAFPPPPPDPRPMWDPVDWERLGHHIRALYKIRSGALHAGVPIPEPLCFPPRADQEGVWTEAPPGGATQIGDATWPAASIPMLLWTFAHSVGGALRAWWMASA